MSRLYPRVAAASMTSSARREAALGWAREWAAAHMVWMRSGLVKRVRRVSVREAGVSRLWGTRMAARASAMAWACLVWWSSAAVGRGTKMAARLAAAISGTVDAPERQRVTWDCA